MSNGAPTEPEAFAPHDSRASIPISVGPYRLIKELGRGGQGVVYLATPESGGAKVALKVLDGLSSQQEPALARFRREAFAAASIKHPGICGVVEVGVDARTPYLAMEYVAGETLAQRLGRARAEPTASTFAFSFAESPSKAPASPTSTSPDRQAVLDAVAIIEKAARAVHAAHESGVIHRDLKPGNIMISESGEPVILDFGLAHHEDPGLETLTRTGDLIGTPAYMSPEQLSRQLIRVDRRTDVWSLGVCLYESITLRRPFEAPTRERLYQAILTKEPLAPSRLNPAVSSDLDVILQTALDKDRDRRYQTALDLADDLRNFRLREPILARPPAAWTKLSRWARRNPAVASLVAGVFLALAAGLTAALVLLARVAAEKDRADESAKAEGIAKVAAEKKRVEAETNLKYAKSANEVLSSVFLDLDPNRTYRTVGDLRDALRENLGKALQKLDGAAMGDPLEVAGMQQTLAGALLRLGDRTAAIPVIERSVAALEPLVGPNHFATLTARHLLATAYSYAGRVEEAITILRDVEARYRADRGADDQAALRSLANLGMVLLESGRRQEALECMKRAVDGMRKRNGPDDEDVMHWTMGLALGYDDVGERAKALELLEELLPRLEAVKGKDHPETIQCLMNVGLIMRSSGKPDRKVSEDALERAKGRLGPDHPNTLVAANNLALTYSSLGDDAAAIKLCEETIPRMKAALGPTHPYTLSCTSNLAQAYSAAKQPDKALPLLEELLRMHKESAGPEDESALQAANALGFAYQEANRTQDAIRTYEESLEPARKALGDDHHMVILATHNLAAAFDSIGNTDRALELRFRAALGVARGGFKHANAETIFGIALRALDYFERVDETAELRRFRAEFVKGRSGADSKEYAAELAALGDDLLRLKRWDEAEATLRPAMAIRDKIAPADWRTFNTRSMLGGALLGRREYADAEPLLRTACEGLKPFAARAAKQDVWVYFEAAFNRLIEVYTATGRPEDASRWTAERDSYAASRPASGPSK